MTDECIGCGACDYSCPTAALSKTDSFFGVFFIDPFLCDDCGLCVDKCPVAAIVADPAWPVCHGRGCPLTSQRLADVVGALWQQRCAECGATLWRSGGEQWACPRCDLGFRVRCPKSRHLDTAAIAAGVQR